MVPVSERMKRIADMVTPGLSVADIGCDHGFVAIYLVTQRQAPKAIAMDVNEGPLIRAREHIEQYGLSDIIEVRLSDGAQKLTVGETQAAIIAGMGGRLTVRIIEQSGEVFAGMKEFVLSPQSDIAYVRKYLYSAGFVIEAEDMVYDEGKYYMIMRCRHSSETGELTEEQAEFGPQLIATKHPVLKDYLQMKRDKLLEIRKHLTVSEDESDVNRKSAISDRINEVDISIEMIKKTLLMM